MDIKTMFKHFREYKKDIEGKCDGTLNLYERHIKEFCSDMNIKTYNDFTEIKAQTIEKWLSQQAEKGNAPSTRNNKLSAIKEICSYLEYVKDIPIDRKIRNIPLAKAPHKEQKYANGLIAQQMIAMTRDNRLRAAIAIIEYTGVRCEEMLSLTCTDIERGYAVITGKGNKQRKIWIKPYCVKLCNEWIYGEREKIIKQNKVKTDLLFISNTGKPWTRQSFSLGLKASARRIGLYWSEEMSPHKLRHGFITDQLNKGTPINQVRDMAGHGNIQTTNGYAHSDEDAIRKAMLDEE